MGFALPDPSYASGSGSVPGEASSPGAEVIVGRVRHKRLSPTTHEFCYPMFMLRLPMTQQPPGVPGLSRGRFGWVSFDERDHGARDGSSSLQWLRQTLSRHGIETVGDVDLVCFPRMLGYAFKPVSFWICRDAEGAVRAVVAEVHNTFGEAHSYVLCNADGRPIDSDQTLTAAKAFHVSPFLEIAGVYCFRFDFGPGRFVAHIDYFDASGAVLETSVAGRSRPLTRMSLLRASIRFPLQALATALRIHWHALLLWRKRVPYHAKPATLEHGATQ